MAVIEELGIEVKVNVNGSAATEYPDEEPDVDARRQTANTRHHYVESVDNTEFAIHVGLIPGTNTGQEWISRSQNHGLSFQVALDGGPDVAAASVFKHQNTELLEGVPNREDRTLRKFLFSPVTTVDDADKKRVASDLKVAQNLGLIRVSVRRVVRKEGGKDPTSSLRDPRLGTHGTSLAEKALKGKAVSHRTALSTPVPSTVWWFCHVEYVDTGPSPLAVFYFKYRSKEALQKELIITRPRSLSIESDLENMSPDEIRRLARERLSQVKDDKKRAVSVKDEDDAKVTESERPFKYVRIEGGRKAIDLTEDDRG